MVNSSRGQAVFCAFLFVWLFAALATAVTVQPQGFDCIGVNLLRQNEPNLTGQGVTIAVICRSITYTDGKPQNDYKPDLAHHCFDQTNFALYNDPKLPAEISEHATGVCSVLFGKDSDAYEQSLGTFSYQGLTCESNAEVFEFWHFLKNQVFNNVKPEADVISASIGSVFDDWRTRGMEAIAERYGTVIVAGIGNGAGSHDLPLYPAAGANIIAVGVVSPAAECNPEQSAGDFSWANPDSSSSGPTADNRCKPDIVAPGNYLVATAHEPNQYRLCGSYSSFSTPVVAGVAALLIQKANADADVAEVLSGDGGNCVIKAILMNTAQKLPYWHKGKLGKDDDHEVPLDYMHGAGVLDALGAYNTLVAGNHRAGEVPDEGWDLGTLVQDKETENRYEFTIAEPNNKRIAVTIAWNRHYQQQYPFDSIPEKDADIRLELWAYDKNDGRQNVLLDYSDSRKDNVEHIYCMADANYTNYEIVVSFADQTPPDRGLMENYGLAWRVAEAGQQYEEHWYDLSGDGQVDRQDIVALLKNIVKSSNGSNDYLVGDINNDGVIDMNDVGLFVSQTDPSFK